MSSNEDSFPMSVMLKKEKGIVNRNGDWNRS